MAKTVRFFVRTPCISFLLVLRWEESLWVWGTAGAAAENQTVFPTSEPPCTFLSIYVVVCTLFVLEPPPAFPTTYCTVYTNPLCMFITHSKESLGYLRHAEQSDPSQTMALLCRFSTSWHLVLVFSVAKLCQKRKIGLRCANMQKCRSLI